LRAFLYLYQNTPLKVNNPTEFIRLQKGLVELFQEWERDAGAIDKPIWQRYTQEIKDISNLSNLNSWLNKFYNGDIDGIEDIKHMALQNLKEIKVKRPPQIHNLDKEGVKYDNIQVGDILQFRLNDPVPSIVQQKVIEKSYPKGIKSQDLRDGELVPHAFDHWHEASIERWWAQNKQMDEIKVNRPSIKLPIIVNEAEYLRIAPILTRQGYHWVGNKDLKVEDFNPWSLNPPMPDKIELYTLRGDLLSWGVPEDLDEIKVNKPKDTLNWNFKEYIPNFKPEIIPVGATILLPSGKDFFCIGKTQFRFWKMVIY